MNWTKARHLHNAAGAIVARICVVGIGKYRGISRNGRDGTKWRNAKAKYCRKVKAKYPQAIKSAYRKLVKETIAIWGITHD